MTDILLVQFPGTAAVPSLSPPCLKVFLALRRLGLPHRVVDVANPMHVRRHSPTGRLPAVLVDGTTISDSVFILDRLERLHPDAPLWPREADRRATDRLWDCFATDTLYWQGFYLRWLVPENRERLLDATMGPGFSARKWLFRVLGRRELLRRARGQGIGGRSLDDVKASFRNSLRMVQEGLGPGPYLQGRAEPGRGDVALAAHFAQLALAASDPDVQRLAQAHPRVVEHVARTFESCGLPDPWQAR